MGKRKAKDEETPPDDAGGPVDVKKQEMEPTPLPWGLSELGDKIVSKDAEVKADIVCFSPQSGWRSHNHWTANQEFICRAANSHEALLALARAAVKYPEDSMRPEEFIRMAKAALKLAGEAI